MASSPYATDYTIERSPSDRAEKLKVPDTRINYPVMQTKNDPDNIEKYAREFAREAKRLHETGNLIKAGGKNYWIDLGTFGHGNPIYDLVYTADYEDHAGLEGIALKVGLEIVARLAKFD